MLAAAEPPLFLAPPCGQRAGPDLGLSHTGPLKQTAVMDDHLKQLLLLGREHYQKREFDKAEYLLKQVVQQTDRFADVFDMLGVIAHAHGDFARAELNFEKAVGLNPNYTEAQLNLMVTYNDLGKYDSAREIYARIRGRAAGGEGPTDPFAMGKIANMHAEVSQAYQDAGMPGEAVSELERAVALCPSFVDLRTRLATLYRDLGQKERAREQLEIAKQYNPNYVQARVLLGVALLSAGEHKAAIRRISGGNRTRRGPQERANVPENRPNAATQLGLPSRLMSVLLRLPGRTRIAIDYVLSACGGVASEQEQHAPPLASAGAAAAIDAGVAAASGADASAMPDGSEPNDAGAADPCPSDTVFCCDGWTGARSRPTCLVGFTRCGAHLDFADCRKRVPADAGHLSCRLHERAGGQAVLSRRPLLPFWSGLFFVPL